VAVEVGAKRESANRVILLVNDDPEWCHLFALIFEEVGFEAIAVSTLAAALEMLAKQRTDIAVIDLMLPDREGFTALQAVKRIAGVSTPVVMVAGYAEPLDRAEAKALGADDLLVLPYAVEDVVESVVRLCPTQDG
jgi:DNA-binding response OmpR family regulator